MDETLEHIFSSILAGDRDATKAGVQKALDAGQNPGTILNEGMIAAMKEVGRRFEEGDYFVPEMLIAARAMKKGLALLKPHLADADVVPAGKVIIGTVKGDLHDIGKNLVSMMLEGAGFDVRDLGVDVPPEKFVEILRSEGADLLAMSALLTTTMPSMKTTLQALHDAGLRDQVKVMIGGAPVTEAYAQDIGADGYAADASKAATLAGSLIG
jgi:5-methyltetrahydrofolate--homocysteine methyltransferase